MPYARKTVKRWKNGDIAQLSSTAEYAFNPPVIGRVMLGGGNEAVLETYDRNYDCTTRDLQLPTNVVAFRRKQKADPVGSAAKED